MSKAGAKKDVTLREKLLATAALEPLSEEEESQRPMTSQEKLLFGPTMPLNNHLTRKQSAIPAAAVRTTDKPHADAKSFEKSGTAVVVSNK